ncbi:hypothetical protein JQN72_05370 [Phycicoccus sp. CSK15P-2]|uniref:hypothetical protein n=1 Tax=Phycicoccus sp. CSK15P-2 TaxID=2807627 RepID=UPI00194F9F6C|nr:hypothetical protein [Phycicoccus sp. CSK15P-2]MBM6403671.1 hypothetical protein [Phycicoccus sp. CSK15P-2]
MSRGSTRALAGSYYGNVGAEGPFRDYAALSTCESPTAADVGRAEGVLCESAFTRCIGASGGGDGPAMVVFSREVERDGTPVAGPAGQWVRIDVTCWPDQVPGVGNALTMAMIREAFHDTDFSVPTVNIQPEGDVTLVNLPTFFEVVFPREGFGPGEVDRPDPSRLMGHAVEVRPKVKSVTYSLGETVVGPTRDLGGPYPDGSVVHSYGSAGEQVVRVDVVYTGQFRVGGSGWIDIPGEVDLEGAPVTLTVREAKSRLYTR